jgi:putative membrane protein
MYDWNNHGWGPGAWIAMGLMMLAFWGLIAALVVYVVRNLGQHRDEHASAGVAAPDQALRVLDERFARGEIDADEYTQRRDLLRVR